MAKLPDVLDLGGVPAPEGKVARGAPGPMPLTRWFWKWRCRRAWLRTGRRLDDLRRRAVLTVDEDLRARLIDEANAVVAALEASGAATREERLRLARDWVLAYVRDALPGHYRRRDGLGVARMTSFFLKAG